MLPRDAIKFELTQEEREVCKKLTKQFGTSYFWATQLFPKNLRDATYVLYAFFRIPDEYVDNAENIETASKKLQDWEDEWQDAYRRGASENKVLGATARLFHERNIPQGLAHDFLNVMRQDLSVTRYATYKNLREYMYGSAEVVGIMMTYAIGADSEEVLPYVKKLGEAMQMTNFLRDMGEDWDDRERIYIPQEDMRRFGVTEEDIAKKGVTEGVKDLVKFEIQRTRNLYEEADRGIKMLRKEGRAAVEAARALYSEILTEIEKNEYDTLTRRAYTSKITKFKKLTPVIWKKLSS